MSFLVRNNKFFMFLCFFLCFSLVFNLYAIQKAEASSFAATLGGLSMAGSGTAGAAGAAALMPYVLIAVAVVGTGAVIYENKDQIVALAQYLQNKMKEGGGWLGSKVSTGWFNVSALWNSATKKLTMTPQLKQLISEIPDVIPDVIDYVEPPDVVFDVPSLTEIIPDISNSKYPYYTTIVLPDSNYILYLYGFGGSSFVPGEFVNISSGLSVIKLFSSKYRLLNAVSPGISYVVYNSVNGVVSSSDTLTWSKYGTYPVDIVIPDKPGIGLNVIDSNSSGSIHLTGFDFPGSLTSQEYTGSISVDVRDFVEEWEYTPSVAPVSMSGVVNNGLTVSERKRALDSAFPTVNGEVHVDVDADVMTGSISGVLSDTGVVGTVPDVSIPEIDVAEVDAITSEIESFLSNTFIPEFLPAAFASFQGLENVRVSPPVISVNLGDLFSASVSEISPGTSNPFDDEDVPFFDFNDFNDYKFQGTPIIEFIRNLIGFGMIYSTLLYIWRKLSGGDN